MHETIKWTKPNAPISVLINSVSGAEDNSNPTQTFCSFTLLFNSNRPMPQHQDQPMPQQINIELGEKEAEGIYSNLAIISHSPAEFVIDFTRLLPGVPKARVHARIIMTPQHAKLLLAALSENISRYEQQYGEIMVADPNMMMPPEGHKLH